MSTENTDTTIHNDAESQRRQSQALLGRQIQGMLERRALAGGRLPEGIWKVVEELSESLLESHVCLDLSEEAAGLEEGELQRRKNHLEQLKASQMVWQAPAGHGAESQAADGPPGSSFPLVLANDRLYFAYYYHEEGRVARDLLARAARQDDKLLPENERDALLVDLFGKDAWVGEGRASGLGGQAMAVDKALKSHLSILTGGPGTGKTRTAARILAALIHQARQAGGPKPHITLVAPTGKAAQRLSESILKAKGDEGAPALLKCVPDTASTIHRALGGWGSKPRHHKENPLATDVVLVDECSMVDLLLMRRLLDATPPEARVILIGDPDQLASVSVGSVFGDICRAAEHEGSTIHGSFAQLRTQHRSAGAISEYAALVRGGNWENLNEYLEKEKQKEEPVSDGSPEAGATGEKADPKGNVSVLSPDSKTPWNAALQKRVTAGYAGVLQAKSAEEALGCMNSFRVLCAHRSGPWGVEKLNELMEKHLQKHFGEEIGKRSGDWYKGRLVLITRNDAQQELYNGDVGVVWPSEQGGVLQLCLPGAVGEPVRRIPLARLPENEPAFAMTIHKSQGSEFNQVVVVLPDDESQILSRELLYTGVTRAKEEVVVITSPEAHKKAVQEQVSRASGLEARLAGR